MSEGTAGGMTDATRAAEPEVLRAGSVGYQDALVWFEARRPKYVRLAEALAPYVPRDGLVLDVGAGIGYFTKVLVETLGLTGPVHLFEPIPNLAALCRKTTDELPVPTVVHEYGLSDEDAETQIFTDETGNLGWNTMITERAAAMSPMTVQVRRFDPAELGAVPTFVKIDVEGAESKVLAGMLDAVAAWSPRPVVLCEIGWGQAHPHWEEELATFGRLLDLGYRVVDLAGTPLDLASVTSTTNVLFVPRGMDVARNVAALATRPKGADGPIWVHQMGPYADERGNSIEYNGRPGLGCKVKFVGSNNRLVIADDARLTKTVINFDCNNGLLTIGSGRAGNPPFKGEIRIGEDGQVRIGNDVSATSPCAISAAEGAVVTIGDDVMFATSNAVRADDGHPIFDVRTGKRLNTSRPITIGNHVWFGKDAAVLGGVSIGDGSVIGYASVVTKDVPNNCIVAGVPARVVRRDIAWERPHLTLAKPYYKPDVSTVTASPYWHLTAGVGETPKAPSRLNPSIARRGLRRRVGRLKARLQARRNGA